jgi:BlaI family transcriptional regulator, penicillinase repressor
MTTRELPPRLELECLKALWTLGEANVRDVQSALDRPLAYTTVMTVLDRLTRRRCVERKKVGRGFMYSAVLSRDSVRRVALDDLIHCFFDGSEESLRHYLQTRATLSGVAMRQHAICDVTPVKLDS